jgi:hypothetical protein
VNYFPEQHVRFEAKHMSKSATITAPDLTQRPPRSPRSRPGGYVPFLRGERMNIYAGANRMRQIAPSLQ